MPLRPDVAAAIGAEINDGIGSQLVEQRVRQLAAATMRVVEIYFRPLISIVWTLSARLAGYSGAMPRMCGQIMASCRDC